MAVATTLSLKDAIDVLEVKFVDNRKAPTLYCLYAVHISSGFCILLHRFANAPSGLATLAGRQGSPSCIAACTVFFG